MSACPVYVLGIDPGFASFGWCRVEVSPASLIPVGMGVVRTEKSNAKRKVFAADDNVRRTVEIYGGLDLLFATLPLAVCAESMSFPRNASAAAKMAMSWGVVVAELERYKIPLLQASPQEVRFALLGKRSSDKKEVHEHLRSRFGGDLLNSLLLGLPGGQHEHALDALAVVVASESSQSIATARRMLG